MAYRDFEVLPRRTATDKELRNKACNITKNLKYDGYQRNFASMIYTCFDKKSSTHKETGIKSENQQFA